MASQELRDALFIPQDQRSNFKQVIAKRSDLVVFEGGRVVPAASGQTSTFYAGQVVGVVTSSGLYAPYLSSNTDGSQVAVGVLSEDVTTDSSGNGSECVVIKAGILLYAALIGLDSGAITALGGKVSTEHGTQLLSIYA